MKLLSVWFVSSRSTLSRSYFTFFSPFFQRKQKSNVSESGPYKPNLKLMWVSTAEGQTWRQRSALEVWAALVWWWQGGLPRGQGRVVRQRAQAYVVQLFCKLPDLLKHLLVKLSRLGGAAVADGENRVGLVRTEANAQLQPIKVYQRRGRCAESFDSKLQYFLYNFRNFFELYVRKWLIFPGLSVLIELYFEVCPLVAFVLCENTNPWGEGTWMGTQR